MARTDYELRTAAGARMLTTPERSRAIAEAERVAADFPGLKVVRVEHVDPIERTVWTAARLKLVAS
jgi:hypothetical protein